MIERLKQNRFLWYQGPMIAWAVALFVQSSIPGEFIPKEGIFTHDKLIHFVIYVLFAISVHRAIRYQNKFPFLARHHYVFTILIVSLYGISDEFHQSFVPNRSGRVNDWLADTLGGIVYVGFHWLRARWKGIR